MQIAIQRKLAFFFAKGVVLVFIWVTALFCLILNDKFPLFFYSFVALAGLALFFGFSLIKDFVEIQRLNWFIEPKNELTVNDNDYSLALKVCLRYRNHATYDDIKTEFGLKHNIQVTRLFRDGLDILIKEYDACHVTNGLNSVTNKAKSQ